MITRSETVHTSIWSLGVLCLKVATETIAQAPSRGCFIPQVSSHVVWDNHTNCEYKNNKHPKGAARASSPPLRFFFYTDLKERGRGLLAVATYRQRAPERLALYIYQRVWLDLNI